MIDAEVVVVGGGPAGTSAAHALARQGADVLLVDRARFPRPKPCAESLSPEASRILADMAALGAIEAEGAAALSGIRVRAPSGDVIAGNFIAAHGFRGFRDRGLSVRREVLDTILLERARAAGVRVEERVRVTDVVRGGGGRVIGVRALADGATVERRAHFVVAADGLRSTVARRLGLSRRLAWPRRLALVTHYTGVAGVSDVVEMHVERDGYVGIADVGRGVTTVAAVVPAHRARAIARDRMGFLDAWLAARAHLASRFADATRVSPVVATGPFAAHARRAWAPGVALVGDAADFFDPFTGEGIYAALHGGQLLAAALYGALDPQATPRDVDAACDAYDAARRRAFSGKWLVERAIAAIIAWPPLINRAARRLAARRDLADLLAGVTGDFVPASEIITPRYVWDVFFARPEKRLSL